MEKNNKVRGFFSWVIYLVVILAIAFLIVRYVGQRTVVNGTSMVDTLMNGDQLITDKISYRFHEPERFDIIVFPYKPENVYYIKRIIGMPGEYVQITEDGTIYIDGEVLDEDYGYTEMGNPGIALNGIQLGDDEYFVLGDNREVSKDSRYAEVGNIKRADITGRAWLRIYPFGKFGLLTDK